jgi:hypothetical protein
MTENRAQAFADQVFPPPALHKHDGAAHGGWDADSVRISGATL